MMGILRTVLIVSVVVIGSKSENDPMSMPKCRHEDKECIAKLCNSFFQLSANGVPALNLVPTNPYEIRNVNVETGDDKSPISLKILFKRANITGISDYSINKIIGFDKDPRKSKFEMYGSVKLASISGPYRISGKFLLLPISGNGHANIFFDDLKLKVEMRLDVETRNGSDYLALKKILITMEPKKMRVNFENLFNNKELSDNMNTVLNENHDVLFKGLQVPIQDIIGDALLEIYTPAAAAVPYADYFINDD